MCVKPEWYYGVIFHKVIFLSSCRLKKKTKLLALSVAHYISDFGNGVFTFRVAILVEISNKNYLGLSENKKCSWFHHYTSVGVFHKETNLPHNQNTDFIKSLCIFNVTDIL